MCYLLSYFQCEATGHMPLTSQLWQKPVQKCENTLWAAKTQPYITFSSRAECTSMGWMLLTRPLELKCLTRNACGREECMLVSMKSRENHREIWKSIALSCKSLVRDARWLELHFDWGKKVDGGCSALVFNPVITQRGKVVFGDCIFLKAFTLGAGKVLRAIWGSQSSWNW